MDLKRSLQNELTDILLGINSDYINIKYSVYRTALKLCRLQEVLRLVDINSAWVHTCIRTFISGSYNPIEFITNEVVTFKELHQLISSILKPAGIDNVSDSAKTSRYLTILIFEAYKNITEGNVSLVAVALFFIVLGCDEIKTKYKSVFSLYAGPLLVLNKGRVGLLLTHFVRIADIVGESRNFGKVSPSVESCFDGIQGTMLSMDHFLQWLLKEPQSIVWLPTMHRLSISKTSIHHVECATCKAQPIVGLRFQCLKCLDYNSCQACFLTQQIAVKSHKLNHPRQEYCLPAGSKQKVNAFARTVRNIVTKRYKQKNLSSSYLPISQNGEDASVDQPQQESKPLEHTGTAAKSNVNVEKNLNDSAEFGDVNNLAVEEKEKLLELVSKLKDENEKVQGTVNLLESSQKEKPDNDEDRLILQNQLDTVMLQNHQLQAELDNLKCVIFADTIMHNSYDTTNDEPISCPDCSGNGYERDEEEVSDISSVHDEVNPTSHKPRKSPIKNRKNSKIVDRNKDAHIPHQQEDLESSHPTEFEKELRLKCQSSEDQLNSIVEALGSALSEDFPSGPRSHHQICVAADGVKDQVNELMELLMTM